MQLYSEKEREKILSNHKYKKEMNIKLNEVHKSL